jgi:hypothetical protein
MSPEPSGRPIRRNSTDAALVIGIVAAGIAASLLLASLRPWRAHTYLGILSFLLLIAVVAAAAARRHRIPGLAAGTATRLHDLLSFSFIGLAVSTVVLGIVSDIPKNFEHLAEPHGLLAVGIAVIAVFQGISIHVRRGPATGRIHRLAGYLLFLLFILQILLGFEWIRLPGTG